MNYRSIIAALAAAAMLAGCSDGGMMSNVSPEAMGTMPAKAISTISPASSAVDAGVRRTSKPEQVLLVNYGSDAALLDYPSGQMIGGIVGADASGSCSDGKGDFWLPHSNGTVQKYSDSGQLLSTLQASGYNSMFSCAYDPKSGNLAVVNYEGSDDGPGSILIFTNATGAPTNYQDKSMQRIFSAAYEGKTGTLFVNGQNPSTGSVFTSLRNGKFHEITIQGGTIPQLVDVSWSTKAEAILLADRDSDPPTIYSLKPSGAIVGETMLTCKGCPRGLETFIAFGNRFITEEGGTFDIFQYSNAKHLGSFRNDYPYVSGMALSSEVTE